MIKMRGTNKAGTEVVLIGLSRSNCERLLDDQPMLFNLEELGLPPMSIALVGGETEEAILADLREHGVRVHGPVEEK